jgi:hypothetical protein
MKKLLILLFTLIGFTSLAAPIKFKFATNKVATAIDGTTIGRGDFFEVIVQANGNGNTTTRQALIDMQYDLTNFELVSINHTGTGGNGGILPGGSTISLSYWDYPGYSFTPNTNNTTTNGTTNYQRGSYQYNQNMANSILRTTVTWSTPNGMPYTNYDRFVVFRFKVKTTSTATTFNPIKLNFVAGWNASGQSDDTFQESPLSAEIMFDQNIGKYVTAKVDVNSNLLAVSDLKVSFRNPTTNTGQLFNVTSTGAVDIDQTLLTANTTYDVTVMHDMDRINAVYNSAITLSDFTTAQGEFTSMGLDGSNGQILKTGQSLYAADINRNKVIDGGDLPRLLSQVVGLDTLMTMPANYVSQGVGTSWRSVPTWRAVDVTTVGGQVGWAYVTPGASTSILYIDMRKFPNGTLPNTIKSIQLLDIYSGPIQYLGEDASWARYTVPSALLKTTDGTSVFNQYITNINNQNVDYALSVEFTFNTSVNNSWGAITTTNWKDITFPKVTFTTGDLGSNQILDLKYLLWGDVNRSHSSQVIVINNNVSTVATNAKASISTNTAFKTMNIAVDVPTSIDVNFSNVTVTSNDVVIPIAINTNGASVGGLQFQFEYDPTKIKFEELKSEVPNTWYIFANAKSGKVKFGALDQNNKSSIKGNVIPFKLKFSTIGSGVDILTSVKISPTMDASSSDGTQLGINLNTDKIKLIGYNNF